MSSLITRPKPVVLVILDGWGQRDDPTDNAIAQANLPNWQNLLSHCPNTLIHTEGRFVGLPDGQMGNSEVGHMNLGAGRLVYQDLTRVDAAIEDGEFFTNTELVNACQSVIRNKKTLHILGLLSEGGVHSHQTHIFAMLKLAAEQGVENVVVHAFLDGRDTPPQSAQPCLEALQATCEKYGNARIGSISGRYFAMDRDNRWDRVHAAWNAMVFAQGVQTADSALAGLHAAYLRGENDEFVAPTVFPNSTPMQDGDSVVFMNFRADRARQLTAAFVDPNFSGFESTRPALGHFVCLTQYDAKLPTPVAYHPDDLVNTLGEWVSQHGLSQLRIAETEKYAHVTFFFSGGKEPLYNNEERILIPSPNVATYDLQPEMSCPELTEKLVTAITSQQFDLIICNIANPDMVGHTGILAAAVQAAEAVDTAIGAIHNAVKAVHGELIITADHGNLEMMRDPETGQPHTSHTVGPVPLVYVGNRETVGLRAGGSLRDVAPTLLDLLQLPQPAEMTGRSLFNLV